AARRDSFLPGHGPAEPGHHICRPLQERRRGDDLGPAGIRECGDSVPQTPSTLYGGSGYDDCPGSTVSGISKSVDGGGTWTATRSQVGCVSAMAVDPLSPSTIYAAAGAIFKSTDAGGSWSTMNSGGAEPRSACAGYRSAEFQHP